MKPLYITAHYCTLPSANPARAYVHSSKTDITRTLAEHDPANVAGWRNPARFNSPRVVAARSVRNLSILDDYDRTDALGHLAGGFKP